MLKTTSLEPWLAQHVPSYQGPCRAVPFEGGQSNPTFRLHAPSGDYVLRRRPEGPVLPSAHQVDREYRVLKALDGTGVPVPRVHALCQDADIIGSAFYVMEFIDGRVFFDPRLPSLTPPERTAIFNSMAETIARLHAIDPVDIGLADYGRPSGYMQRQFARWSQQYRLSETIPIPAMDRLIDWLPSRLSTEGESRIVHGDLRLDNMLVHPTEPRIVAVLDWELSTLGDPLSDLGNNATAWRLEPDLFRGLLGPELPPLGIPTEPQYLETYMRHAGRTALPGFEIYIIFNLFRLAAIMQGIAKRSLDGTASSAEASKLGIKATPIANRAWELASHVA